MKKLSGNQIRAMWLDFFRSKGHEVIPSASLIPHNDPTLLWINAGVAPLKKYFDGREKPNNPRMCNAQKSIRTNDIDNVGRTARHHTFFEMLGNFSIGDYFREEALTWAFELLTSEKWFALDLNRLYFTYYPTDKDTFNKWVSLGVAVSHLIPLEDNFWEIGEGPCGPDTEIFFDRGEKYDPEHIGIRLLTDDIENDRYIEIWNIVFSQFNSKEGVKRSQYKELPSKNIDTGMGLERITCIMQETPTNYETDLFFPLIQFVEDYTGIRYNGQMAFKVIADHIRSVTFAISDGAMLTNEGRGYVLRRLLRRAVRYGRKLGITEPFLYKMVKVVVSIMESYYPYLKDQMALVERQIKNEEEKFLQTLEVGEKRLLDIIASNPGKTISGASAFLLYDTFGFPFELTKEVAEENGVNVDEAGFKEELENQRERARQSRKEEQSMNMQNIDYLSFNKEVRFTGYDVLEENKGIIIGLFQGGKAVDVLEGSGLVVTDVTPFYGESGGQAGDTGKIYAGEKELDVVDTIKLPHEQIAHLVETGGASLKKGDVVRLVVDAKRRGRIMANHSATHLLNQSLRNVLGGHVSQHGSSVNDTTLRFDFNNYQNPTSEEILKVEKLVKEAIAQGFEVHTILTTVSDAKARGAQAVFGEKYGNVVRLVDMDYSKELCGGTHVKNTRDIVDFAIIGVEVKGSGLFRVEAVTKEKITDQLRKAVSNINQEIEILTTKGHNLVQEGKNKGMKLAFDFQPCDTVEPSYAYILQKRNELENLKAQIKDLEKTYDAMFRELGSKDYTRYLGMAEKIGDNHVIVAKVDNTDVNILKDMTDKLASHFDKAAIVFVDVFADHLTFIAKAKGNDVNCGELVKMAALFTGGNGGGRRDFAQAGGKDLSKADEVVLRLKTAIKEKL